MKIKINRYYHLLTIIILCGSFNHNAFAASDQRISGAKLCTKYLQRYERKYGIPAHLLSAISSTESGRYHKGLKIKLPWPWTINVEGKGYFFNSKEEAIQKVRALRQRGIKSIDVGCMQVNLLHHPNAFPSLEHAFEPKYNIEYAAKFLRELYNEEKSWKKAATYYHSKTPKFGNKYIGIVYNSWINIINKLREARLAIPKSSTDGIRRMSSDNSAKIIKVTSVTSEPQINDSIESENMMVVQPIENVDNKISNTNVITVTNRQKATPQKNNIIVMQGNNANNASSDEYIRVSSNYQNENNQPQPMVISSPTSINKSNDKNNKTAIDDNQSGSNITVSSSAQTADAKIIRLNNNLTDRRVVNKRTVNDKRNKPNFIFDN
ncbi:MAG: transglycosylase SLT domain-containing protein [Rickettsiales bacterium]